MQCIEVGARLRHQAGASASPDIAINAGRDLFQRAIVNVQHQRLRIEAEMSNIHQEWITWKAEQGKEEGVTGEGKSD